MIELEWDVLNVQIADQLKEVFMHSLEKSGKIMELNLGNVNKIDLSAISLLLSLKKTLEAQESQLVLTNCTNGVMDALALCGCLELFEYADE